MKPIRQRDTRIPRRPLLWMSAALLFTLPAMFGALAAWVSATFFVSLIAKLRMEPKGNRLRSNSWKLGLAAVALSAIFATYGSIKGLQPGVSILALLMSIKILEAHTARDFQVMVMVAFVLCFCGFLLGQDLAIALCLFAAFALLIVALIQFHRGSTSAIQPTLGIAFKLLAQATPLIVLLFLFFPRVSSGFRFQTTSSGSATSGFSDQLAPGSVASLANSSNVAFRVEFPDGKIPRPNQMYWRGVVMWQCDGLEWRAPVAPAALPHKPNPHASDAIRQWITIEPHNGRWMFSLDWPIESPSGASLAPGNYLWSARPIEKARRYEVSSFPASNQIELHGRERVLALQVPASISPTSWSLVQSWKNRSTNPRSVVNSALEFFRTQGFRYSLSPGEYKKNDLDEFLFHRRLGFCEHYAAGFATLMRLAGIPARVVTGYLGGEYNELGHFFIVRQADAHAWCEVWLPESGPSRTGGWERVDPTGAVAPDRVNLGFNSLLEKGALASQTQTQTGALKNILARWPIFTRARLVWQTLNYSWDVHVLSFDADAQQSLFESIGLGNRAPFSPLALATIASIVLLLGYAVWNRLRNIPPNDRIKALYEIFCEKLRRLGVVHSASEGPLDFCQRASRTLPNESDMIRKIADDYIALRYSRNSDPHLLRQFAIRVTTFGRAGNS
jgi:transglutaminase-like putative cysteine protease